MNKNNANPWAYNESKMISVCTIRNAERCKDCMYYGKACNAFKVKHRGVRPIDYDPYKHREQSAYFNREKRK